MARDFGREYRTFHGLPKQIALRARRNKDRREMEQAGRVSPGDGKDVDHKVALKKGGSSDRSNLRVRTITDNRSDKG
tara:strand:+ start:624 stop:854 length:231 start_codon:yes stop_codon:yes gene_type:complete